MDARHASIRAAFFEQPRKSSGSRGLGLFTVMTCCMCFVCWGIACSSSAGAFSSVHIACFPSAWAFPSVHTIECSRLRFFLRANLQIKMIVHRSFVSRVGSSIPMDNFCTHRAEILYRLLSVYLTIQREVFPVSTRVQKILLRCRKERLRCNVLCASLAGLKKVSFLSRTF